MIKMFKNRQKFCLLNKKENNENEEMEEIKPKPITKEPDENNNENSKLNVQIENNVNTEVNF